MYTRRSAIAAPTIAAATTAGGGLASLLGVSDAWSQGRPSLVVASSTNPLAAQIIATTVVTPRMDVSIRFYRDLYQQALIGEGRLGSRAGALAGRRYALLQGRSNTPVPNGVIRLLEAPLNALPNRPPPKQAIMDDGYAAIEALTSDDEAVFRDVTSAGFETISPPLFYHQDATPTPPGVERGWDGGDIEVKTFAALGPAGEMVLTTRGVTLGDGPWPKWEYPTRLGLLSGHVLVMRDRWPAVRFYNRVLGLRIAKTQYLDQEMVNRCIGAPDDAYYYFGNLGERYGSEWWEFRQVRPFARPPWPASLERTGLAMMTVSVADLRQVAANIKAAGIAPLQGPTLPLPTGEGQGAIHLRGALGELIEIVGRKV